MKTLHVWIPKFGSFQFKPVDASSSTSKGSEMAIGHHFYLENPNGKIKFN